MSFLLGSRLRLRECYFGVESDIYFTPLLMAVRVVLWAGRIVGVVYFLAGLSGQAFSFPAHRPASDVSRMSTSSKRIPLTLPSHEVLESSNAHRTPKYRPSLKDTTAVW